MSNVIVVGAGLAGLSAARWLVTGGSVLVAEAMAAALGDRVVLRRD